MIAIAGSAAGACGSTEPGVSVSAAQQSEQSNGSDGAGAGGGATVPDGVPPSGTGPDDTSPDDTSPEDTTLTPPITGPDSTGPDSTGPDSTGPDPTGPDSTGPDSTGPDPDTTEPVEPGGTSGIGDELFPDLGNAGIDVTSYDIALTYDPDLDTIDATVTLSIAATAKLEAFTLDQVGLDVRTVTVDGSSVDFSASDPELRITPATPISAGSDFVVAINYSADPSSIGALAGISAGWFPTRGGSFTLNEPDGARTWLPSNDHPSDKATYRFAIHLPDGYTAVANGDLESSDVAPDGGRVWVWNQPEPMTTYLIQVLTGELTIIEESSSGGLPLTHVVQVGDEELMRPFIDVTPEQIDYFDDFFGPYPFDSYGIAMTEGSFGGALEQQGRSLFGSDDFASGSLGYFEQLLLSHELAHQWFGDAVSPARWQDIWLNESFASYGEWMWLEHTGFLDLADSAQENLDQRQDGFISTGEPGLDGLFSYEVYGGGAVVLHALRLTIGDDAFFGVLQRWVAENLDTSRTSDDFIAVAESVSGQDLTQFFDDWLYATDLPDEFPT